MTDKSMTSDEVWEHLRKDFPRIHALIADLNVRVMSPNTHLEASLWLDQDPYTNHSHPDGWQNYFVIHLTFRDSNECIDEQGYVAQITKSRDNCSVVWLYFNSNKRLVVKHGAPGDKGTTMDEFHEVDKNTLPSIAKDVLVALGLVEQEPIIN